MLLGMTLKVAVAGASGYAGGEILRLLLSHPAYISGDLEIGALTGASTAGVSVAELMPHLPELANRIIEPTNAETLLGHDVVFLGLPHGYSAEISKQLHDDVLVIDCAADFRLQQEEDWDKYYGSQYAGSWPYGIPEMPGHRQQIQNARRIAAPGCFPTGATLALLPAVCHELIIPDIALVSITGVSGAGKKASVAMLGAETIGSAKAYNTGGKHRHVPEIIQNLSEYTAETVKVSFTPVLAPMTRGILTTATAPIRVGVTEQQVRQAYAEFFANEPFVQLLATGLQPQTQHIIGSNMCQIQVEIDEHAGKLLMTSVIDNLTKGTAGGAIQCMNIALGYPEIAGLPQTGLAP